MPHNLKPDSFKIISLIGEKPPTSINLVLPAFQFVGLREPVQVWRLAPAGDDGVYRFAIGGYRNTGVIDGKVAASINPETDTKWHLTYREFHDAYTIELAEDQSQGWTVPEDYSINPKIEIKPIASTKSFPPQFRPSQLFVLEQVPE